MVSFLHDILLFLQTFASREMAAAPKCPPLRMCVHEDFPVDEAHVAFDFIAGAAGPDLSVYFFCVDLKADIFGMKVIAGGAEFSLSWGGHTPSTPMAGPINWVIDKMGVAQPYVLLNGLGGKTTGL